MAGTIERVAAASGGCAARRYVARFGWLIKPYGSCGSADSRSHERSRSQMAFRRKDGRDGCLPVAEYDQNSRFKINIDQIAAEL